MLLVTRLDSNKEKAADLYRESSVLHCLAVSHLLRSIDTHVIRGLRRIEQLSNDPTHCRYSSNKSNWYGFILPQSESRFSIS